MEPPIGNSEISYSRGKLCRSPVDILPGAVAMLACLAKSSTPWGADNEVS